MEIAASLENGLKHPIAEAIMDLADENGVEPIQVKNPKYKPGYGIIGGIDGKIYFLGQNPYQDTDTTSVFLESEGKIIGRIKLKDEVRSSAPILIKKLAKENIKTIILTGDNLKVAEKIARKLKIDKHLGGLLPEDKFDFIENLKSNGGLPWSVMASMMRPLLQQPMLGSPWALEALI